MFYINLPAGGVALIITWFTLKLPGDTVKWKKELFSKIDYLGVLGIFAACICILTAVSLGGEQAILVALNSLIF